MATDQDNLWKEIIQQYLFEFLAFFFSLAHRDVNWDRPPEFLDKELAKINRKSKLGQKLVDKLVKVYLKDGSETWLLIHVEVQGYYDANFEKRMYTYNHRISDYYDKEVVSLAILTDNNGNYKPSSYKKERWGIGTVFNFKSVKLLDYKGETLQLEQNMNPFALVVLAYLKLWERRNVDNLYRAKLYLAHLLYQRRYTRQQILDFLWFIDWLITLPPELEDSFELELAQLDEQEEIMPYISSFERVGERRGLQRGLEQGLERGLEQGLEQGLERGLEQGLERGLEQGLERGLEQGRQVGLQEGRQEGMLNLTLLVLGRQVGAIGPRLKNRIRKLSITQLEQLAGALLDFSSKADLTNWLKDNVEAE